MDAAFPPDAAFEILDGVHRAVAARDAGLPGVLATIYQDGSPPVVRVIEIDRLFSPKAVVWRFDKDRDVVALVASLGTVEGRAAFESVTVIRVNERAASRTTRLADVVVSEVAPEEE